MKISNTKISRARITSPVDYDVHFSDVVLLLHMNGTSGSTTFTDSSLTPKTVTANGNAQISTAQIKFGSASGYFDGSGDYLSVPDNNDFEFGAGEFTIECWVYASTIGSPYATVIGKWGGSGNRSFMITINSGPPNTVTVYLNDTLAFSSTNAISLNSWNHIAVVRSGNTFSIYINGNLGGTPYTNAITIINGNTSFYVGANQDVSPTRFYTGYIDDLRVTKGVARYTGNFTPPTRAFPDYGGRVFFSEKVNNIPTTTISDVAFFSNTVNNLPITPISDVAFFSNTVNNLPVIASRTTIP